MAVGITSAVVMASPYVLPGVHDINKFPIILGVSLLAALLGTFLTKPEEEEVLKDFYRRVRPWGFWGPVHAQVVKEDPGFQRNKDFFRDMFNIVIGTIWQTCFIVLAMFLVTRHFRNAAITLVVLVITSIILKFNWYDKLPAPTPDPDPVPDLQGQPETGAATAAR
jgi:mannose/fructose/N-acetylgalactosamine-specific phosphotransferase system component IID